MDDKHQLYKQYVETLKRAVDIYDQEMRESVYSYTNGHISFKTLEEHEAMSWKRRLDMCDRGRDLLTKIPCRL